jgi:hypothetical protein
MRNQPVPQVIDRKFMVESFHLVSRSVWSAATCRRFGFIGKQSGDKSPHSTRFAIPND